MNIVEILKDCQKGTKLYSPIFGEVEFMQIDDDSGYPILVKAKKEKTIRRFTKNGKYFILDDGECLLFPSKENRDWSTFKAPKKEFKKGDFVVTSYSDLAIITNSNSHYESSVVCYIYDDESNHIGLLTTAIIPIRYASEEEKQKLLKALDEKGYIWDAEKLELRKKEHEFKPFEKVLARNENDHYWTCTYYSFKHPNAELINCCGFGYRQCIPYEGNEHLLGTTNKPENQ